MTRMSDCKAHRAAAVFVVVVLSVSVGLVVGASRNAAASGLLAGELMAQAAPAPATPGTSSPAPQTSRQPTPPDGSVAHVEARISKLHKQLHITAAQEPQFKAFADVMRSNAEAMRALFHQRAQSTDMTAVTRLRWYAGLTAAHAEALNKLVPVFDALYQSMSDKQKKTADAVFGQLRQRRPARRAG